jgi:hypothetical protein
MFKNMTDVIAANQRLGQHWFSKGAMEFFNTVIETDLIDGRHFITSDRMEIEDKKRYAIREVDSLGRVQTIGNIRDFASVKGAEAYIETLLRG